MPWMPRKQKDDLFGRSFDLSVAFKDTDIKDAKYGPLVRSLRNIEAVTAIHADLREAKKALEVAHSNGIQPQKDAVISDEPIIVEALFVHSLMLYCRAVHSGSKSRFRIDTIGKMSIEEKDDHKFITTIRDNVVAHYGSGESLNPGPWIVDHVVFHAKRPNFEFSYPQMRIAHTGEAVDKLQKIINRSIDIIIDIGTQKQDALAKEVQSLQSDDDFRKRISGCKFDEKRFFGKSTPPGSQTRYVVPRGERPSD